MSSGYARHVGWLVEFPHGPGSRWGSPCWWSGTERPTTTALGAIRFSRREDAERAIASSPYLTRIGAYPTEHCWGIG